MDLKEALVERKVKDALMQRYSETKAIQSRMNNLKATGLDKLQALMNEEGFIGGDWCQYMSKMLNKVEGWG